MDRSPSPELLQALINLARSADGKRIIAMFEAERRNAQERLESATEDAQIRKLQGKAQFLKEFLERVRDASDILEKMRR
ncbi:MAG: hypothetical protein ACXWCO_00695 [Caldimonas sp.]